MTATAIAPPTISLAADLGTSASKFFYRVGTSQFKPLWMGAEVAEGLTVDCTSLASMLVVVLKTMPGYRLEDEVVLVGDIAKAFLDTNSLTANKAASGSLQIGSGIGCCWLTSIASPVAMRQPFGCPCR